MIQSRNASARRRDALSVACTTIFFGSIVSPFALVAIGVLGRFPPAFAVIAVALLGVSTGILAGILARESRLEAALRKQAGAWFSISMNLLVALCLLVNYALLRLLANFTLFTPLEYWFNVVAALTSSSALCLLPVTLLPPSRLEKTLSARLGEENPAHRWYRLGAYVLFSLALALCGWIAYRYSVAPPAFPG